MIADIPLYSRSDIALAIDASSTEFEHMTRVGVLRPVNGTAGNRAHRRFDATEYVLINILASLWRQGVGPTQLLPVADRFHESVDWFGRNALVGNEDAAEILIWAAKRSLGTRHLTLNDLRKFTSWNGTRPLSNSLRGAESANAKLNYEDVAELLRAVQYEVSSELAERCASLSKADWDRHLPRYCAISHQAWSLSYVRTLILYQDRNRRWHDEYEVAPANVESFTTINLVMLKKRLFAIKPPRTGTG